MSKKVKLAVFDNDLKARIFEMFPVSEDGKRIQVKQGGTEHFKPTFDNHSFIEFPKKFLIWNRGWERVYFAKKGAKKCVNFRTEDISLPDPEQLKRSIGSTLLNQLGQEKPAFPSWVIYVILLVTIGIALKVFGVIA